MRLKLISCRVMFREMEAAIARATNEIDVSYLPQGLHDIGCAGMFQRIDAALEEVDESRYDAVIFGYGLCGNGLSGLRARTIPIVLPRAHDCIALFMGSKERYQRAFEADPGIYYKTSGWIESREEKTDDLSQLSIPRQNGLDLTREEYIEKYGEKNGAYLFEILGNSAPNYGQYTFIEMGVEPDDRFEKRTRRDAKERGWKFAKIPGDMTLFQRLLNGQWEEEGFLVVPPGFRVMPSHDGNVISAEKTPKARGSRT